MQHYCHSVILQVKGTATKNSILHESWGVYVKKDKNMSLLLSLSAYFKMFDFMVALLDQLD